MAIPFTQFLRPNGKQIPVLIDMPADVESLAAEFIARSGVFEIEELSTGLISMEALMPGKDDFGLAVRLCLAGELCNNGPPVVAAVEKMIRLAHARMPVSTSVT